MDRWTRDEGASSPSRDRVHLGDLLCALNEVSPSARQKVRDWVLPHRACQVPTPSGWLNEVQVVVVAWEATRDNPPPKPKSPAGETGGMTRTVQW